MPFDTIKTKRNFGWLPDRPDPRDRKYSVDRLPLEQISLPASVDLRAGFPLPPYDQGALGSCVSNALAANMQYLRLKQKLPTFMPSRLFIYYNARLYDGNPLEDSGTYIRTGVKVLTKAGFAHETLWDYDISRFDEKPSKEAYEDARRYYPLKYFRVNNKDIKQVKNCLAAGYPVVFGFAMFENFFQSDEKNGVVPMPDGSMIGGHCVLLTGYDDSKELFQIRNSFGTNIADSGYYYMPYEYIINPELCDDFWTIRLVSSEYKDRPIWKIV